MCDPDEPIYSAIGYMERGINRDDPEGYVGNMSGWKLVWWKAWRWRWGRGVYPTERWQVYRWWRAGPLEVRHFVDKVL